MNKTKWSKEEYTTRLKTKKLYIVKMFSSIKKREEKRKRK